MPPHAMWKLSGAAPAPLPGAVGPEQTRVRQGAAGLAHGHHTAVGPRKGSAFITKENQVGSSNPKSDREYMVCFMVLFLL